MDTTFSERNRERADRIEQLVELYQKLTGTDRESVVRDLVCDLRHWLDFNPALDLDWDNETYAAINMHYAAEIMGDD